MDNDSHKKKILKQLISRRGWGRGICWNLQNFLWSCQKILWTQAFSWKKWGEDKCIWGDKVEWLKTKTSNNVVTLKKLVKNVVFQISESHDFYILPCGHLILIFIRRILPPLRTIWAFQGVNPFSNKCSSTAYTKSALDLVGEFFLKMMLGDMSEWRDKKNSGGEGGYLSWMLHSWRNMFFFFACNKFQ